MKTARPKPSRAQVDEVLDGLLHQHVDLTTLNQLLRHRKLGILIEDDLKPLGLCSRRRLTLDGKRVRAIVVGKTAEAVNSSWWLAGDRGEYRANRYMRRRW